MLRALKAMAAIALTLFVFDRWPQLGGLLWISPSIISDNFPLLVIIFPMTIVIYRIRPRHKENEVSLSSWLVIAGTLVVMLDAIAYYASGHPAPNQFMALFYEISLGGLPAVIGVFLCQWLAEIFDRTTVRISFNFRASRT